jgi:predicted DCC family thiol-disulfide oxidoreductase YuxK
LLNRKHPPSSTAPLKTLAPLVACTVYFDGLCPVCSREISTYRRLRGGESIDWVDASRCDDTALSAGLDRASALRRLHVRRSNGTLVSGAAAFVEIWQHLPAFAWLARRCANRPTLLVLDKLYDGFLRLRRYWRAPAAASDPSRDKFHR